MKTQLAPPGIDVIDAFGDSAAPRSGLAGCVGPLLLVALIAGSVAWASGRQPEPTPLPEISILPTATITPTVELPTPTPLPTYTPYPTIPPPATLSPVIIIHEYPTGIPTLTPTPPRDPWVIGTVANAPDLNCRAGPGRSYPRITVYGRGTVVRLVARDPGATWGRIDSPDQCWLHLSYIAPEGPPDALVWLAVETSPPLMN